MTEDVHGPVRVGGEVVEPLELLAGDVASGLAGDRRVQDRESRAREVDSLDRLGGERGALVHVVVAPGVHEQVAERLGVELEEVAVLLVGTVGGEIALHQHEVGIELLDLVDRSPVHGLRVGLLAITDPEGRAQVETLHDPALDLAEVHVVHGGERGQALTGGASQRAEGEAVELVDGVRLEVVVATDRYAVVHDRVVVGDGRQLHRPFVAVSDGWVARWPRVYDREGRRDCGPT